MANINKINVGGVNYDIQDITSGYSKVEISNLLSSGIALGTITLNDQSYVIYAPNTSSAGGGLDVTVGGTNLNLVNQSGGGSEPIASRAFLYGAACNLDPARLSTSTYSNIGPEFLNEFDFILNNYDSFSENSTLSNSAFPENKINLLNGGLKLSYKKHGGNLVQITNGKSQGGDSLTVIEDLNSGKIELLLTVVDNIPINIFTFKNNILNNNGTYPNVLIGYIANDGYSGGGFEYFMPAKYVKEKLNPSQGLGIKSSGIDSWFDANFTRLIPDSVTGITSSTTSISGSAEIHYTITNSEKDDIGILILPVPMVVFDNATLVASTAALIYGGRYNPSSNSGGGGWYFQQAFPSGNSTNVYNTPSFILDVLDVNRNGNINQNDPKIIIRQFGNAGDLYNFWSN